MLRTFENLALLKEVRDLAGVEYESQLKKVHRKNIISINRVAFLPKHLLDDNLQKRVTNLDNYFLMAYLCKELGINKSTFRSRIKIMQTQKVRFFDFKKVCDLYFIRVNDVQKELLQKYEAVKINIKCMNDNQEWMKGLILFGDISVVLY